MSESERSPKRQRTSLSPASPPYHLTKQEPRPKPFVQHPQTPQSPSRMSAGHGSPTSFSQTIPTPPQTAGLASQSSTITAEPHQSVNVAQKSPVSMPSGSADDIQMTTGDDVRTSEVADHRHTDHDRTAREIQDLADSLKRQIPLLCQMCKTTYDPCSLVYQSFVDTVRDIQRTQSPPLILQKTWSRCTISAALRLA